jgi:hypothetical protein
MLRHPLAHLAGLSATLIATVMILCAVTPSAGWAVSSAPQSESVTNMFGVLRHSRAVALPDREARTLARLHSRVPGSRVQLDAVQARRIGSRSARLYLIPGANGICVVHGRHGVCSDNLARLSSQGVRFVVAHQEDPETGLVPGDLYGALPDGLTTVSVVPHQWGSGRLVGANAHQNGYLLHLGGPITSMMITGPRGGASIGPLGAA